MNKAYYAVKVGRSPGIYRSWPECEEEVRGFKGAKYKKFKTEKEALEFINGNEKSLGKDISELKDDEAIAYVDGSFNISDFTYSYGVVYFTKNKKETFSARDNNKELSEMRNVSGELKGAMVAMELSLERSIKTLYLYYDYIGIEEWAKGNWKTNKDGTKSYKEYYDSIKEKLEVRFIKVKAHSGDLYNEEADKLAKEAL